MRVFHLTTVHDRYDNRILNKQCLSLAKHFDTLLIVADGKGDDSSIGLSIMDIGKPKGRLHRMLFKTYQAFSLANKNNADVYQIHDPELLPLGFVYSLLGKKVVYDIHEDYITSISSKSYLPKFFRLLLSKAIAFLEHFFSFRMYKIVAEKYYCRRFPKALQILNYPTMDKINTISSFAINSRILIYTGNVTVDRGVENYARLSKEMSDYRFKLVGKCYNEIYKVLRLNKLSNLELIGLNRYVPFDEIVAEYKKGAIAGLAIFPHKQHYLEKELTKFFEYMAVGLPIIASNFPVWKELIEGNGVGICVDPDNLQECKEAIEWIVAHPVEAKEMGEKGKMLIETKLNWENQFEKFLGLYGEIAQDVKK